MQTITNSKLFSLSKCLIAGCVFPEFECVTNIHISSEAFRLYKEAEQPEQMWVLFRYCGLMWITKGMQLQRVQLRRVSRRTSDLVFVLRSNMKKKHLFL